MEPQLAAAVRQRLADAGLDEATVQLVTAACTGTPLDRSADATWPDDSEPDQRDDGDVAGVFLAGIAVEGFRGIGPRRELPLTPGPGLTLVVGRNGSGKSSFAEALEMCLTGTSSRWAGRPKAWQETWRNLHHDGDAAITTRLVGVGDAPCDLIHRWPDGENDVTAGHSELDDGRRLRDLGWAAALNQFRPLLSFNELGGMFDGRPADLYDAIAAILGVDPLRGAVEVLRQSRLADSKPIKAVTDARKELISQLRASHDDRADDVLTAIDGKDWDLPAALAAVQEDTTAPTSDLSRLRALIGIDAPHPSDAAQVAEQLRDAAAAHAAAAATDAGRADRIAQLLRQAIACVDHDGPTPCPLCGSGTVLDDDWRSTAEAEAERLADQARVVRDAEAAMSVARQQARRLMPSLPATLEDASLVGVNAVEALAAWQRLLDAPEDPGALARHLVDAVDALDEQLRELRAAASRELDRRQDDWRPLAVAVTRWVEDAREARLAEARAIQAQTAEKWLAACATEIEAERFAPIREAVRSYWERLRLESNVSLEDVSLYRAGQRRSLELDVTVDETGANALGVMSQGELHSLALAVFLPRATLDESPFRFVVLDDPVQAMDPARVEGLATVLAEVAKTRQVVVMTHDTRLPDAVRQLQIPATVWEVHRRPRSEIDLRTVDDPVDRYLDDARAVARTEELPAPVRAKLVAQMGRGALEALTVDRIRRRWLGRGIPHSEVERRLDGKRVHDLIALALFDSDDRDATTKVTPTLAGWFDGYADVLKDCKRGTHVGERVIEDAVFVRHLDGLVKKLRQEAPA
ncbi:AAA family ATPase [Euzebya sp.]|uniref:AAA family ATPase n=1 Tax=Euzebya sp. TaxID=1971409 RepID=UPI00351133A0